MWGQFTGSGFPVWAPIPLASAQILTVRDVSTVDSKLQENRRMYLEIAVKHITELLKSFKEFRSSGFENYYNLQHCKT